MKKLLIFFCICLAVIPSTSLLCNTAYNSELASYAPEVFFLANSDTDTVIFSKNENMISAPASLVKIATAVLALEFCENLDTQATVSESAIAPLLGTGSTVAGLVAGEKLRMRDLLYCLLLPGANDAANVIAEQIAKEIPVFINLKKQ